MTTLLVFFLGPFALLVPAIAASLPTRTLLERETDRVLQRTLLVSPENFTPVRLRRYCERVVGSQNARRHLVSFTFVTESESASKLGLVKPLLHRTKPEWREMVSHGLALNFAWLFSLNGSAVLLMRHRDGRLERHIIKGTDPTATTLAEQKIEILHLGFTGRATQPRIRVFLRSHSVSEDLGKEALRQLYRRTALKKNLTLAMRSDAVFADDPLFPAIYPFDRTIASESLPTPTVHCSGEPANIFCTRFNATADATSTLMARSGSTEPTSIVADDPDNHRDLLRRSARLILVTKRLRPPVVSLVSRPFRPQATPVAVYIPRRQPPVACHPARPGYTET